MGKKEKDIFSLEIDYICTHEAGHAVVAIYNQMKVRSIKVQRSYFVESHSILKFISSLLCYNATDLPISYKTKRTLGILKTLEAGRLSEIKYMGRQASFDDSSDRRCLNKFLKRYHPELNLEYVIEEATKDLDATEEITKRLVACLRGKGVVKLNVSTLKGLDEKLKKYGY